jgi:hypothetical protein
MKKIAYVYYLSKSSAGLFKKVADQARCADMLKLPIEFIVLNRQRSGRENNIRYVQFKKAREGFISRNLDVVANMFANLNRGVPWDEFHRVVLRYPTCLGFGARSFFRTHGDQLVLEHHSDAVEELKLMPYIGRLFSRVEAFLAPRYQRNIRRIVGVTEELTRYGLWSAAPDAAGKTISNGIAVAGVSPTGFQKFDGKNLNLIFVGSSPAPWHGVDRLLLGLQDYQGPVRFTINLIGEPSVRTREVAEILRNHANVTVNQPGKKYGDELNSYFQKATLAVSTLALHRKKLTQACSLKTREYIARGVPFIYAYDDADVAADAPFALRFLDDESALDVDRIIDFAKKCSEQTDLAAQMRDFALKQLDWSAKLTSLYEFACS